MTAHRLSREKTEKTALQSDIEYVNSILNRFPNPWHRYLLTMALDAYADALECTLSKNRTINGLNSGLFDPIDVP